MKKLTIDNMHELQPWIALAGYEDCNANVVTMLMWQYPYPFYFEVHAQELCRSIEETGRMSPEERDRICALAEEFLSEWRQEGANAQCPA